LHMFLQGRWSRPVRGFQITSDRPGDYAGGVDVTFFSYM
jgi:hypothetical protein